jgi:hypothetical protein
MVTISAQAAQIPLVAAVVALVDIFLRFQENQAVEAHLPLLRQR